jgi:hypothetical protein
MHHVDYFDGHKVYVHYMAIKKHFTTESYDFFKYGGKIKSTYDTFKTKQDAFFFQKLSKKKEYKEIILSNMLVNPKIWIGDLSDTPGEENYLEWKKRMESLSYRFKIDLKKMKDDFASNFLVQSGCSPFVVDLLRRKEISLETFTILSHITNSIDFWEKKVVDRFVFDDILRSSKKYYPFIEFDKKKFVQMTKDRFLED